MLEQLQLMQWMSVHIGQEMHRDKKSQAKRQRRINGSRSAQRSIARCEGFAELATAATAHNELDTKTKELMAVAIGIAIQCEGCIDIHTKLAHRHGASRQQLAETIALAIYMGGGPASVYGAKALQAYDEFSGAEVALEKQFIT